jgi:hypothetical protein
MACASANTNVDACFKMFIAMSREEKMAYLNACMDHLKHNDDRMFNLLSVMMDDLKHVDQTVIKREPTVLELMETLFDNELDEIKDWKMSVAEGNYMPYYFENEAFIKLLTKDVLSDDAAFIKFGDFCGELTDEYYSVMSEAYTDDQMEDYNTMLDEFIEMFDDDIEKKKSLASLKMRC